MDSNNIDTGKLRINVTGPEGIVPIDNASIQIANTGTPNTVLETINTDANGNTETIDLAAPPVEYSMEPTDNQPYSEYHLRINAPGYSEQLITGVQIFSTQIGIQNIRLIPNPDQQNIYDPTVIGGHTLWEAYPPKIAEAEIKPLNESGEIVLRRVVVPETIVVHNGTPGIPLQRIIMFHIWTISKMLQAVKYIPRGRNPQYRQMFWQSCHLP